MGRRARLTVRRMFSCSWNFPEAVTVPLFTRITWPEARWSAVREEQEALLEVDL